MHGKGDTSVVLLKDMENNQMWLGAGKNWPFTDLEILYITDLCNKHILVGVWLNGERRIVVHIIIVDDHYSLVGARSYRYVGPGGIKSNH